MFAADRPAVAQNRGVFDDVRQFADVAGPNMAAKGDDRILGGAGRKPEELRSDIRWIKERVGGKPYGVDLLVPASFVEGNREDLEAMIPQGHRDFVSKMMTDNNIPKPSGSNRRGGLGPEMLRLAPPAPSAQADGAPAVAPTDGRIGIEQFMSVELRVAKVLAAERVPKSKKLMQLRIDAGTEERALVQALVDLYSYVYSADPEAMRPAAQARVTAMDISDRWVEAGCDPDDPLLAQERDRLVASYTALRKAV